MESEMSKPNIDYSKLAAYSQSQEGWMVRNDDGQTYGPYSSDKLLTYAKEGRINARSLLKHEAKTKGEWVSVVKFKAIFDAIPTPPTPSDAVLQQPVVPERAALFDFIEKGQSQRKPSLINSTPPPGFVSFILAFLDPTFKYYVTPAIICITWCFFLFLVVSSSALEAFLWLQPPLTETPVMRAQQPLTETPILRARPMRDVFSEFYFLFRIIASVFAVLWIRVLLESGIVLFDISNTLKRIAVKT